jgi:tRNA (cmo5U34)-methyltransferase
MQSEEWNAEPHVRRYLKRADEFPRRAEGESVIYELVPDHAERILDLGTGDGRLLALLLARRPEARGVGLDFSEMMLAVAATRFDGVDRIELVQHNLVSPLPALGGFDAVVSSMVIHHLDHERKRALYGEVFELLTPGGVFANFEHEDPSDRLLDVEAQLAWLREWGFADVDCYWKWREMALIAGIKPTESA